MVKIIVFHAYYLGVLLYYILIVQGLGMAPASKGTLLNIHYYYYYHAIYYSNPSTDFSMYTRDITSHLR